ncbi:MAG TPA: glycosyl transferase family protein [Allosphingosinicella sp.]|jgi:adsorption protein B
MDGALLLCLDFAMREAALFAACGFLVLGASDLAVDLIWIGLMLRRRLSSPPETLAPSADELADAPGPLAVFIPAWDESAVIGRMLSNTLNKFSHGDYRLYVGCYPNDPATIAAVRSVCDPRVRLVIGQAPGGTTKADCLNRLWAAMLGDEAAQGRRVKAVVLHDAEDVVHPAELRVFDRLIERFDLVQLPVLPIIDRTTTQTSNCYADEFAESHGKELVVRQALGASVPSAGVGCAFSREALQRVADANGGLPFDADSLTEDYELGLKLHAAGGRSAFVRLPSGRGVVATREYFPGTVEAAVAQKSRWMTGIALSGWDRLGWSGSLAERWMRLRDRQSVLAAILLVSGYAAFLLWLLLKLAELAFGVAPAPMSPTLGALMLANSFLLVWRLAMRCGFVAHSYGWREGLKSIPRVVIGNLIAILAAREAVLRYLLHRRSGIARWDKTAHAFPAEVPAE